MTRGDDRRDPLIALRIPPALDQRLRADAEARGTTISAVVREALEQRLAPEPSPLNPSALAAGRIEPANETGKPRPVRHATRSVRMNAVMCEHRVRVGNFCRRCNARI